MLHLPFRLVRMSGFLDGACRSVKAVPADEEFSSPPADDNTYWTGCNRTLLLRDEGISVTLPSEPSTAAPKPRAFRSASWRGFILCLAIGFVAGVLIVEARMAPLVKRMSAVEEQVKGVSSGVEAAKVDAALAKAAMEADGYLALGTPNAYQDLGLFWQVHGLQLVSDPQGCRVTGEILYRLMVRRQNVELSATLISTSENAATALGTSVLATATPGKYEKFSIPVRTGAKLSDIGQVYLKLNEHSGTAGALY